MTTRLMITSLALVASMFAADPAGKVRETSGAWRQAVIQKDEATLQRVLADDLTYSHANGRTQNKAEYMLRSSRPDDMSPSPRRTRKCESTAGLRC